MNRIQANYCLLTVSICWSAETILLKNVPSSLSAFAVVFLTNLFAAVILGVVFFGRLRKLKLNRRVMGNIALLAAMNVAYNVFYTMSLRYLAIPTAVFLRMSTYLIVPIGLLILRRHVEPRTWIGLALVIAGIFVSLGSGIGALDLTGIALMLGSCTVEACYLIRLNDYAKVVASEQIIVPLLGFVTLFSGIVWAVLDPNGMVTLDLSATTFASLLMDSIFVCCIAMTLNVFAQKVALVQDAVIIYSLQTVFSVLFAALLPGLLVDTVPLSVTSVTGCLLVCLGNIAAELDWHKLFGRGSGSAGASGGGAGGGSGVPGDDGADALAGRVPDEGGMPVGCASGEGSAMLAGTPDEGGAPC